MTATSATRPVLYILPGLLCDESVFAHQIEGLKVICEVRAPHFRGLDSIDAMARFVLAGAPRKFSLAGFSMGGRVAMQIMRIAPERVERLCLFDTGATPEPVDGAQKRKPLVDIAYTKGRRALADVWLPPMLGSSLRDNVAFKAPIIEMIERSTPADHEKQIKALVERPDMRDVLPKITCPTLIVCGAQDAFSTPAQHREMADSIPGAELLIIEDAGHFVSMEQPEVFTRALRKFMGM